jgi:hypothetical protein
MREKDLFGWNLQIGNEPAKDNRRREPTEELSEHKQGNIQGPDACKCVTKAPRIVTAGFANDVEAVNQ